MGRFERSVLDRDIEIDCLRSIVVDNQQFFFRRLTQKRIVSVVPSDVPLLAGTQRGMALTQSQQRLHITEYILLFGSTSAGGKSVTRITCEASREITPVVGVGTARHCDFVPGINLWNPAQGQQQSKCGFEVGGVGVF